MSSYVLDASALLTLLNQERGEERVTAAVAAGAAISAVNLSEVITRLLDAGMPEEAIHEVLDPLGLEVVDFDAELAYHADRLRVLAELAGLSLGALVCLALAQHLGLPVLTADRSWEGLPVGVPVQVIRP